MQKEIKVTIKSVYGKELIYPVCEDAMLLSQIHGKKTFDKDVLVLIQRLGYDVKTVSAYQLEDK